VIGFWSTPGSLHVFHLIKTAWDKRQNTSAEHLSEVISASEDASTRELLYSECHSTVPRPLLHPRISPPGSWFFPLQAKQLQYPTSLIFAFNSASRTPVIYGVSYTARSSHVLNVTTAPTPGRTVTEDDRNHSRNQGYNPDGYEEILTCKSCCYRGSYIRTTGRVFIHMNLHLARKKRREKGTPVTRDCKQRV